MGRHDHTSPNPLVLTQDAYSIGHPVASEVKEIRHADLQHGKALPLKHGEHDLFPCLCFLEMDLKGDHIAVFGAGDGVSGLEE